MKFSVFTVGTPEYDLEETLIKLKEFGYDGWLSFEDFSNEATTDEKLKFNLEYIKSIIQE